MRAGARLAVVVVDVQNDFCSPDGTMAARGLDVASIPAAVSRVVRLVDAARDAQVPVVHVRTAHDEQVDSAAWDERYSLPAGTPPPARNCRTGTWGAEPFVVTAAPGELVHVKHRYSGFTSPGLDRALRDLGVETLLICGVATEICVETTLRDAVERDFRVVLVTDACASYDQAAHESAVARIARHWGRANTTDGAIALLGP
ncbi:cysteine hydrolase family protein [Georgenia sp. Z1491]|uniref:cysteine hydrolase family protein n=1 Tax=Georgenia sp. Z1491 TaxID=3416707 RepID=UPI003CEF892F